MPIEKTHTIDNCYIAVWKITESIEQLIALIDDKNLLQSPNFLQLHNPSRQKEWLAVRLLLQNILASPYTLQYTKHGKPFLASHHQNISITHTKGYAAVALSSDIEIGIDIELYSDKVSKIKEKFLNPSELLFAGDDTQIMLLFWCAKEAVFKIIEETDVDFDREIEIDTTINLFSKSDFIARFKRGKLVQNIALHSFFETDYLLVVGKVLSTIDKNI